MKCNLIISIFLLGIISGNFLVSANQSTNNSKGRFSRSNKIVKNGQLSSLSLWAMVLHLSNKSKYPYKKAYNLLKKHCLERILNSRFFKSLKKIVKKASKVIKKNKRRTRRTRKIPRKLKKISNSFNQKISHVLSCKVFPRNFKKAAKILKKILARKNRRSSSKKKITKSTAKNLSKMVKAFGKYKNSKEEEGSYQELIVEVAEGIVEIIDDTRKVKKVKSKSKSQRKNKPKRKNKHKRKSKSKRKSKGKNKKRRNRALNSLKKKAGNIFRLIPKVINLPNNSPKSSNSGASCNTIVVLNNSE